MARRGIKIGIALALLVSLCGCNFKTFEDRMDEGLTEYAEMTPTESLVLVDTEEVIDVLMINYAGSFIQPAANQLTDDEYRSLLESIWGVPMATPTPVPSATGETTETTVVDPDGGSGTTETTVADPSDPVETTVIPEETDPISNVDFDSNEVSNFNELTRVFHKAYDDTVSDFTFTFVDGYYVDVNDVIASIYTDLQRIDPIDVCGVESWSWWNNGNQCHVFMNYFYEIDELISIKEDTKQLVEDVVVSLDVSGKTDYEIVYTVNKYLCDTVYYPDKEPYPPISHTAYGALKNGCAVCEGYACAASAILTRCGVECDIEVGECIGGGGHAWNLVKLDDKWYQLDVCWDDGSSAYDDYFLVNDDFMRESRYWDESKYPICKDMY